MVKTHVDLVMVTYESALSLPTFFQSLRQSTKLPFRLLVIDNNSQDQSKAYLQSKAQDHFFRHKMQLVFNKKNLGVAKAWNQAVRMTSSRYIVFLNPDLKFTRDWLPKLIQSAARHKKAMVVGAKILNPDGSIYHAGADGKIRGKGQKDRPGLLDQEKKVRWVQGSCFLVKREIFTKIGGFDEQFFMYGEEVDFCWRVRKAGYEVLYAPVPIYHYRQGANITRKERLKLRQRSAQLLRAKWKKK
jgi:GT2 family glycosyltransferase